MSSSLLIEVDRDAHDFVSEVVAYANGEVGGVAYVEMIEPSYFYVSEFVVLKQEASVAHVDIEGEDFVAEISRAAAEGKEEQLRCSWHSHGDLDVYYSGTDEEAIKDYKKLGMPWLLSLVYNKKGKVATRLDIFDSAAVSHITMSDLEYSYLVDPEISKRAKEVVKECVSKPKTFAKPTKKNSSKKDKQDAEIENVVRKVKADSDETPDLWDETMAHMINRDYDADTALNGGYYYDYDELTDPFLRASLIKSFGEATVDQWTADAKMYIDD
jgi:hypothetical protein